MIDFRYLLITIVSIFLAITVGLMIGGGFLGEPIRAALKNQVKRVRELNQEARRERDQAQDELRDAESFVEDIEPHAVRDALRGQQVVVFTYTGAEDLLGGITKVIEDAGGEVLTTVVFSEKLAVPDQAQRDELALLLQSVSDDPRELRADAATEIGQRVSAAGIASPPSDAEARVDALLGPLEDNDYLSVDRVLEDTTVPTSALFLVVGGSTADPPFDVVPFTLSLSIELSQRTGDVLVAEPSDSKWGLVQAVRNSGEAEELVSTVDDTDSMMGRIALVLALNKPSTAQAGHYGTGPGADAPVPAPLP